MLPASLTSLRKFTKGAYQDSFMKLKYEVPILIRAVLYRRGGEAWNIL